MSIAVSSCQATADTYQESIKSKITSSMHTSIVITGSRTDRLRLVFCVQKWYTIYDLQWGSLSKKELAMSLYHIYSHDYLQYRQATGRSYWSWSCRPGSWHSRTIAHYNQPGFSESLLWAHRRRCWTDRSLACWVRIADLPEAICHASAHNERICRGISFWLEEDSDSRSFNSQAARAFWRHTLVRCSQSRVKLAQKLYIPPIRNFERQLTSCMKIKTVPTKPWAYI